MKIYNSIALVTGANRGLGRELVRALLNSGARKVYATARQLDSLTATLALDPTRVLPLRLDVTNDAQVKAAAQAAADVNLLFNNAGVLEWGSALEVPNEKIHRLFDTNFYGLVNVARNFAPTIEARGGGAIVNVLTLVALASMPGLATYNASKAAAWSLTQSLRASLASKGIQVVGVFPAGVDTDMLKGVDAPKAKPADVASAVLADIEADHDDIFPDPISLQTYAAWKQDHKAVEKQFATM